jgi:hypothetical protein
MTGAGRIQVATVSGQGIQDMTRDGALMTKYMTRNSVVRTKTRDGVLRMEYSGHDHVSTRARNMRDRNLLAALCSTLANKKRSLCLPPSLCLSRFLSLSLFSSLPHTHTHLQVYWKAQPSRKKFFTFATPVDVFQRYQTSHPKKKKNFQYKLTVHLDEWRDSSRAR